MSGSPQRWSVWLLAGVTLLGIAGWQVARISVGQQGLVPAAKLKGPPKKTRSAGRVPLAAEIAQADPVGAYLAKAKRGMTEQEIRWMLDDFLVLGLDHAPTTLDLAGQKVFRAKQQAWYGMALAQALSLSPDQRAAVKSALRSQLEEDFQTMARPEFQQHLQDQDVPGITRETMSSAYYWLGAKLAYAPWNLCELTESQKKITLQKPVFPFAGLDSDPFSSRDTQPLSWISADDYIDPILKDPLVETEIRAKELDMRLIFYLPGTGVFPLTPDQNIFVTQPGDPLAQARLEHPAQLRMALLLHPERVARNLTMQLDPQSASGAESGGPEPDDPFKPPVATDPSPTPDSPR